MSKYSINPLVSVYLSTKIVEEKKAIIAAKNKKMLSLWVFNNIKSESICIATLTAIRSLSLQQAKQYVITAIKCQLLASKNLVHCDNPWIVADAFGEKTLPVTIRLFGVSSLHNITEEMFYGMMVAADGDKNCDIFFLGSKIFANFMPWSYIKKHKDVKVYQLTYKKITYKFHDMEFLMGLMKMAKMLSVDLNKELDNFSGVN